jgi:hypothetical protein
LGTNGALCFGFSVMPSCRGAAARSACASAPSRAARDSPPPRRPERSTVRRSSAPERISRDCVRRILCRCAAGMACTPYAARRLTCIPHRARRAERKAAAPRGSAHGLHLLRVRLQLGYRFVVALRHLTHAQLQPPPASTTLPMSALEYPYPAACTPGSPSCCEAPRIALCDRQGSEEPCHAATAGARHTTGVLISRAVLAGGALGGVPCGTLRAATGGACPSPSPCAASHSPFSSPGAAALRRSNA